MKRMSRMYLRKIQKRLMTKARSKPLKPLGPQGFLDRFERQQV